MFPQKDPRVGKIIHVWRKAMIRSEIDIYHYEIWYSTNEI